MCKRKNNAVNNVITVKHNKIKLGKNCYSTINAISEMIDKYSEVYSSLAEKREGCFSAELYEVIDNLLISDYKRSVLMLEKRSKASMKYLKGIDKKEKSTIFWYKFRRFIFHVKRNEKIEKLIEYRNLYKLEMARLFEDMISSSVRLSLEPKEEVLSDEEPNFAETPQELFDGTEEAIPLRPDELLTQSGERILLNENTENL